MGPQSGFAEGSLGINTWRKVEGVMRDSWISRKRKGKVLIPVLPRHTCKA